SVGMVRVIICHQLNTKNNIISGSEVSRLSVAIHFSIFMQVIVKWFDSHFEGILIVTNCIDIVI
ncbi:hypothetical protein, partial [Escherichia coli]|uniref:hypothetical protein n=1 Tax=Escherichia coli TaxID=562 RepID=UPI001FF24967